MKDRRLKGASICTVSLRADHQCDGNLLIAQGTPILNRLGNMLLAYRIAFRQIGDGARDLQHAVIGTCRPVQSGHGIAQQLIALCIRLAIGVDLCGAFSSLHAAKPEPESACRYGQAEDRKSDSDNAKSRPANNGIASHCCQHARMGRGSSQQPIEILRGNRLAAPLLKW
jgi:hypothetical protein